MSIQYFGRGLNDTEPDRYSKYSWCPFLETMFLACSQASTLPFVFES